MKRFFGLLMIIAATFIDAASQNLTDARGKILDTVNSHDYAAAVSELQRLKASDPKSFAADDYDYLLARMAESDGQLALAMATYQSVKDRDSALRAYALLHMSRIARSTGNLLLERIYLREIAMFSPDSLIARAVAGCIRGANSRRMGVSESAAGAECGSSGGRPCRRRPATGRRSRRRCAAKRRH